MSPPPDRTVGAWLLACCGLLLVLVVVGGLTRLTSSGLSIVEWKPVTGVVPPLNALEWAEAFDAYRASPEYRLVNAGMSLEAFQRIYWMEWFHRLWGRLVGLFVALPLAWFVMKRRIDRRLAWRLAGVVGLGGLQGAAGWYMVRSGLVDVPAVSATRLTLHLTLALALYALLLWTTLDTLRGTGGRSHRLTRFALVVAGLVALTVASGGLVAGTHAGRAYNTFPLMAGALVPPGLFVLDPAWRNLVENILTIQFQHRVLALFTAAMALVLVARVRSDRPLRRPALALGFMALLQPSLGIATLLLHVPMSLAVVHQLGGFVFASAALWMTHALRHPGREPAQNVQQPGVT